MEQWGSGYQRLVYYVKVGHKVKLNKDNTMHEWMHNCIYTNTNNNIIIIINGRSPVEIIIMISIEIHSGAEQHNLRA
jgi:hypothetical protein